MYVLLIGHEFCYSRDACLDLNLLHILDTERTNFSYTYKRRVKKEINSHVAVES